MSPTTLHSAAHHAQHEAREALLAHERSGQQPISLKREPYCAASRPGKSQERRQADGDEGDSRAFDRRA
jgi:hypothetical protein